METTRSIRFLQRRVLAQYEHAELEITDVVAKSEDLVGAVKDIMGVVQDALYGKGEFSSTNAPAPVAKEVAAPTEKITKTRKEEVSKKSEEPKTETPKQGEVVSPEAKPQVEEKKVETPKVEEKAETPKVEEKKAPAKKEAKLVVKPSKDTNYDRTLEAHKNNLGAFLDTAFPSWRKKDNLVKAREASEALQGKPFLDANGNILESFKGAFSTYMVDLV